MPRPFFSDSKEGYKRTEFSYPVIVYNGTFVMDNVTEEILIANYFDDGFTMCFAIYSRKVSIRLYTLILTD